MTNRYEAEVDAKSIEEITKFVKCEMGIKKSGGQKFTKERLLRLEAHKRSLNPDSYNNNIDYSMADRDFQVAIKYMHLLSSAKRRGIEFKLTLSDVSNLLSKRVCEYSGEIMTLRKKDDQVADNDLTIDRLDNKKGYVRGNVFSVCHAVNSMKNELTELCDKGEFSNPYVIAKIFSTIINLKGVRND